jgi:hypothetical protein
VSFLSTGSVGDDREGEAGGFGFAGLWPNAFTPRTIDFASRRGLHMKTLTVLLFLLLICSSYLSAQTETASDRSAKPLNATYCEISKDPAAYNHKLVRLTSFVSHGFEDFQLFDLECPTQGFSIWLMYGGKAESNTAYCCPGEGGAGTRLQNLTVEGVEIPLVDNLTFHKFTDLISKEQDTTVHATVVGMFFSGEKRTANGLTQWGGAGHLGCCSLLAIQQIESFDPHTRRDVDYTAEAGSNEKEGCKVGSLHYLSSGKDAAEKTIAQQKMAESGQTWMFNDPTQVAIESLKPFYPGEVPVLRRVKKTPVRQTFQWKHGKNNIVVVVTRPYWLSFYAASANLVWASTTIKEAACQ